jgi:polysaccharide export outer membrane protein
LTPTQIARLIEEKLSVYIKEPIATVLVGGFVGPYSEQVRIIGEASKPQSLSYREDMTLLDVMISVGGLTEFANGNGASVVRIVDGQQQQFSVRLNDLVRGGDISANANILPGDIVIIPESWF